MKNVKSVKGEKVKSIKKVKSVDFKNESVVSYENFISLIYDNISDNDVKKLKAIYGEDYESSNFGEKSICHSCYKLNPVDLHDEYKKTKVYCHNCGSNVGLYDEDGNEKMKGIVDGGGRGLFREFEDEEITNPLIVDTFILKRFKIFENTVDGEKSTCLSFTLIPTITKAENTLNPVYQGVRTDKVLSINYTFRGKTITKSLKVFSKSKTDVFKLSGAGYTSDMHSKVFLGNDLTDDMVNSIVKALGFNKDYQKLIKLVYSKKEHLYEGILNFIMRVYKFKDLPVDYFLLLNQFVMISNDVKVTDLKESVANLVKTNRSLLNINRAFVDVNTTCRASGSYKNGEFFHHNSEDYWMKEINVLLRRIDDLKVRDIAKKIINDKEVSLADQFALFYHLFHIDEIRSVESLEWGRSNNSKETVYELFKELSEIKNNNIKHFVESGNLTKKNFVDYLQYPFAIMGYSLINLIDNIDLRRNFMKSINDEIRNFAMHHMANSGMVKETLESLSLRYRKKPFNEDLEIYRGSINLLDILNLDQPHFRVVNDEFSEDIKDIVSDRRIINKTMEAFRRSLSNPELYKNNFAANNDLSEFAISRFFQREHMHIIDSMRSLESILESESLFDMDIKKYMNKKCKELDFQDYHNLTYRVANDVGQASKKIYNYGYKENIEKDFIISVKDEEVHFLLPEKSKDLLNFAYKANNCCFGYQNAILKKNTLIMQAYYKDIIATIEILLSDDRYSEAKTKGDPYVIQVFDKNNRNLDKNIADDKIVITAIEEFAKINGVGLSKNKMFYSEFPFSLEIPSKSDSIYSNPYTKHSLGEAETKLHYED